MISTVGLLVAVSQILISEKSKFSEAILIEAWLSFIIVAVELVFSFLHSLPPGSTDTEARDAILWAFRGSVCQFIGLPAK